MALAFRNVLSTKIADRYLNEISVDFDNSYPAGGEAIANADLDLGAAPDFVLASPTGGFSFEWDYANAKLKVLAPTKKYTATFDPASLGAITSRDDVITFTGVAATDEVIAVIPPNAIAASVTVQNARVTGADSITVRLTNASAGAVDVASGTWTAYVRKANGASQEVPDTTDLSALIGVRVLAWAKAPE